MCLSQPQEWPPRSPDLRACKRKSNEDGGDAYHTLALQPITRVALSYSYEKQKKEKKKNYKTTIKNETIE